MNSFTSIPSHCNVIVPIDHKWIVIDVATVDCIDGVLCLSDKLEEVQTVANGVRYKFKVYPDMVYGFTQEVSENIKKIDSEFIEQEKLRIGLMKEEPKRDENYTLIQPIEMEWIPRFSIQLPKKNNGDLKSEYLPDLVNLPSSLPLKIAEILLEETCIKDKRTHHYKQWLGMRYTAENKYILAGYRYIVLKRPYSDRDLKWCGGVVRSFDKSKPHNDEVPQEAMDEVLKHLREDIGIKLSEGEIKKLKFSHNYNEPNIDHVWSY